MNAINESSRQRQSALEWAAKAGTLQGIIDELERKADRAARETTALRLWKRRAVIRMGGIHDDLLERETIDGDKGGDGTGLDAARCRELRVRLGNFLDDREE
jgi:hypothetical protein